MLFNSYEFLFAYLPIVLTLFFLLGWKSKNLAAIFLGGSSLIFYAYFNVNFLPILIGSILINYFFGLKISKEVIKCTHHAKKYFLLSLIFNILLLSFFKYTNFIISTIHNFFNLEISYSLLEFDIALPIGISFFTFTQIAFLADCYKGKVKEKKFSHYVLFVTYFPHLIAGPVLHHAQMMPQFSKKEIYRPNFKKIGLGLVIFAIGLSKKVLLANPLAEYADHLFNARPEEILAIGAINSWLSTVAYTLQIYFDFSGYTDMAIGISLLFGISLPINFNSPYKSKSIIEFWRRWHISLSSFLKDYLYIPLGGNQNGPYKRYLNLITTMILGGLWHGANWTFVLWGLIHGMLLSINHIWRSTYFTKFFKKKFFERISFAITFLTICLTWVLFRSENIETATLIYKSLFGITSPGIVAIKTTSSQNNLDIYTLFLLSFLIIWFGKPSHQCLDTLKKINLKFSFISQKVKIYIFSILTFFFIMYCTNKFGQYNPFLYFQF